MKLKLKILSALVNEVPVGFSKREEIILQQYFQQTKDCNADCVVSVKVPLSFEKLEQIAIDQENHQR